MNGGILEFQIAGIKENSMVFFTHGNGELIHDAAVYAVIIVFGILSNQSQILICDIEPKHVF